MKFLLLSLIITISTFAHAQNDNIVNISINDVTTKVSKDNFKVYANALKVYQAKETIQVARMNLLPKLNLWRIAGIAIEASSGNYSSLLGIIGDIAPFLVPANWFRLEASKVLYKAEEEGYRALWANEIMTAKALYAHLLLDKYLYQNIKANEVELKNILLIVQSREMLGGLPQKFSTDIEIKLLELQEDLRNLDVLIAEEDSLLSYMMGLPANTKLKLQDVKLLSLDTQVKLDYEDFEFRAIDSSPELKQFDYFYNASDSVKKEAIYSFLGTSGSSRGAAGGIFDNIPIQDGLGFGLPASMRIISAQKEILSVQKKGILETIKRQLKLLVNNYNLDIDSYENIKKRVELTSGVLSQLFEKITLGQEVDIFELTEATKNHIQAQTHFISAKYRFVTNEDKLARLIFHGDYYKKPVLIEELTKRK